MDVFQAMFRVVPYSNRTPNSRYDYAYPMLWYPSLVGSTNDDQKAICEGPLIVCMVVRAWNYS
jgi:hypothetical protein